MTNDVNSWHKFKERAQTGTKLGSHVHPNRNSVSWNVQIRLSGWMGGGNGVCMLGSFNSTASGHLGPLGDNQQSCKVVGRERKSFTKRFKICFCKTMCIRQVNWCCWGLFEVDDNGNQFNSPLSFYNGPQKDCRSFERDNEDNDNVDGQRFTKCLQLWLKLLAWTIAWSQTYFSDFYLPLNICWI